MQDLPVPGMAMLKIKQMIAIAGGIIGMAFRNDKFTFPRPFLSFTLFETTVAAGTWNPWKGGDKLIVDVDVLRITEVKHSESSLMLSSRLPLPCDSDFLLLLLWLDDWVVRGSWSVLLSSMEGVFKVGVYIDISSALLFRPFLDDSFVSWIESDITRHSFEPSPIIS